VPGLLLVAAVGVPITYALESDRHPWSLVLAVFAALLAAGLWLAERQVSRSLRSWLAGSMNGSAPTLAGVAGESAARIERALRSREQERDAERDRLAQFLSAIEALPSGLLLIDADDAIQWLNPAAADHFGIDVQRDRGQVITNLVRAPSFVGYLQSGRTDNELVMPSPRGDATLAVLVRPYGGTMRLVLSQDITERERTDAMRRDFVANGNLLEPLEMAFGRPDRYEPALCRGRIAAVGGDQAPQLEQPPCICTGGHLTEPYEQNTQQSPDFGRSTALQCSHS
jgi:two-component system phosphate regulon sensor histidine kinase PhoR